MKQTAPIAAKNRYLHRAALARTLLVLCLALPGCMDDSDPAVSRIDQAELTLDDNPSSAQAQFVRVPLPDLWTRMRARDSTSGWYRFRLPLTALSDASPALLLPWVIPGIDDVRVNGVRQGNPEVEAGVAVAPIDRSALRSGTNVIDIRFKTTLRMLGSVGPIYVGPRDVLTNAALRIKTVRILPGTMLGSAALLLALILAAVMRGSSNWLYLRTQALGFAFLSIPLFASALPLPEPDWLELWLAPLGLAAGGICLVTGLRRQLNAQAIISTRTLVVVFGALAFFCLVVPPGYFQVTRIVFSFAAIMLLLRAFILSQRGLRLRGERRYALWVAAVLGIAFGLHDLGSIIRGGAPISGVWLSMHLVSLVIVLSAWSVLRLLRADARDAEQLRTDLTARVAERERELEATYAELASEKSERAVSEERDRLMLEIHDGVGGQLVSALAMLDGGRTSPEDLGLVVRQALDDLRLLVDSLEPHTEDLGATLGMLRMRLEPRLEAAGVRLHWDVATLPPVEGLASGRALHVMRVAQEALSNSVGHGRPTTISLHSGPEERGQRSGVFVEIEDNGGGAPDSSHGGRGLRNMRERARLLGGEIDISSSSQGTRVSLWLPCDASPEGTPESVATPP